MDRHTPGGSRTSIAPSGSAEVLECDLITGNDADYQLKVVVRDMEHYQHFLLDKLTHISGVTGVRSSFVLRRIKHKTALPSTTWADNPPASGDAPKARGGQGLLFLSLLSRAFAVNTAPGALAPPGGGRLVMPRPG